MRLSALCSRLPEKKLTKDVFVRGLCTDSRIAERGDVFFCLSGKNIDGHLHAEEAVLRGASALVCERELNLGVPEVLVPDGREALSVMSAEFYSHPEEGMKIIGVTGTNGKTTVTHMIRNILREGGIRASLIGTLGAFYADRAVAPSLTTPDPVFLFSLLAEMKKAGTQVVVMETSAHALYFKKELPVKYEVGVFTNLTRDHLDFFGEMSAYGEAKRSMFSPERCRFAVLNADDNFSRQIERTGVNSCYYGMENPADAFAVIEEETLRYSRILLNLNDELCEAKLPLTGRHNVYNALASACCCRRLGVDISAVSLGLERTKGVDGRLEWVGSANGADIFVDFAHTPDGLNKCVSALKKHCEGRLFVLFGCGGNRDAGKRAPMGECVAKLCDYAVLTSDNPRYEDATQIIAQIEEGYRRHSTRYAVVEERKKATEFAISMLKQGDILLVAGKGGENYQEIMGIKYDYNDKAVIRSILEKIS